MNKARIAGLIVAIAMIMGNIIHTQAAGNVYYVSPTGNDANPGTSSAPFKTFAKANSLLTAGSTLNIYAGTYSEQLKITKSGTSSAWITVKPAGGAVILDMKNAAAFGINLRAAYVTVSGLEVRNSADICVNLVGSNLTVDGLTVHECASHGIQANDSSQVKILNSRVYRTALSNASRSISGGWPSGIKVRVSSDVLIQGNTVYNNYGEGMGTRGINVTIRGNTVYDNFSVNIYTNSENATIEGNFVYCTPDSGYERDGYPAAGISMGEEYFDGWGARLKNARVINNIVAFCKHGVRYNGAEDGVTGGGLKNATIAYNTLYGSTNSAISIVYESAQAGSLIADNIVWQAANKLTTIDNPAGLTFKNNLWRALPAAALRSPGDRIGDPRFAGTPGYTAESFRPSSSSPAAAGAVDVGIANDYFLKARGPLFDIGAIQSASGTAATPTTIQPTHTAVAYTPTFTSTAIPPTSTSTALLATATFTAMPPTAVPATATYTSVPVQPSPTAQITQQSSQLPQETNYDNKDGAFVYSAGWAEEIKDAAIGGSFARTSTNGSSVTFQFSGQSFSLIYKGGPSYRKMDVYLDDVLVATIDQRHDVSTYKARWDYTGQLSAGQHTLKLVFVTTSSSTSGSVDAVIVR
ncbi:MAG: right-handed parallel beta-helix repeat-containing protein [Anaerolineales bacterium]